MQDTSIYCKILPAERTPSAFRNNGCNNVLIHFLPLGTSPSPHQRDPLIGVTAFDRLRLRLPRQAESAAVWSKRVQQWSNQVKWYSQLL